jgi:hypothetical protein
MPKQNEGRSVVDGLTVTGDLPTRFQQFSDSGSVLKAVETFADRISVAGPAAELVRLTDVLRAAQALT